MSAFRELTLSPPAGGGQLTGRITAVLRGSLQWLTHAGLILRLGIALPLMAAVGLALGGGLAAVSFVLVVAGPGAWSASSARRHNQRLESQLAGAVEHVARAADAGGSLRQGLDAAAGRVDEPLATELRHAAGLVELGERPGPALAGVAEQSSSTLFRLVASALAIHEETGGRLDKTLRGLATVIRDRRSTQAEVDAATAQARLSGVLVAGLPVVTSFATPVDSQSALPGAAAFAVEAVGWGLALAGLFLILRMTRGGDGTDMPRRSLRPSRLERGFARLGARLPPSLRQEARTRALLAAAGRPATDHALDTWAGIRVAAAATATAAMWSVTSGLTRIGALGGCLAGWLLVEARLRREAARRRRCIEADLPEFCDLVALGLTGGASLRQAFLLAAVHRPGLLDGRLATAAGQLDWGARLEDALAFLTREVGSDDLDEVVATLSDVNRLGSEASGTLEALAADQRLRRRFRAQGEARVLSVRILVPLVFCVLPAFGLLTVVPMLAHAVGGLGV
ncbi:MAG: type II secretion system F family protein [Acidimicrobiia bacterium]|nr:type II secretion system F family protein [Acidimicrobiia bacterium]